MKKPTITPETLIHDVRNWMKESSRTCFPLVFYVSPAMGVKFFYVRRLWNTMKHELKKFVLKQ